MNQNRFQMQRCLILVYLFALGILLNACANQVRPNGGSKDVEPPTILSSLPSDNELNVNTDRIYFEFDEFVRIDVSKVVVTPTLSKPLLAKSKGKKVTLEFQEELRDNTTYSVQFANAITDITEGNTLLQTSLVFSTGSYLDSLQIEGSVTNYSNGELAQDVLVGLYNEDDNDSVIITQKPLYFTKTDDRGMFKIYNLKNIAYKIIAIQDKNSNLKWEKEESMGKTANIFVTDSIKPVSIFITDQQNENYRAKDVTFDYKGRITWKSEDVNMKSKANLLHPELKTPALYVSKPASTEHFLWIDVSVDSVELEIINNTRTDTFFLRTKNQELEPLKINNLSAGKNISVSQNPSQKWITVFNHPLQSINEERILLLENDSIQIVPTYNISRDSLIIDYNWKYNTSYQLKLHPESLVDWYGQMNDTIEIISRVKEEEDFGSLEIQIEGWSEVNTNTILQLRNERGIVVYNQQVTDSVAVVNDLEVMNYGLSIYMDENKNGQWDSGNILLKKQPEKKHHYSGLIQIRGNWDIRVEMNIND